MGGSIESLIADELAAAGIEIKGYIPQVQSIAMARVRSHSATDEGTSKPELRKISKRSTARKVMPLSSRQTMGLRSIDVGDL
jgi:urocanate hydratase